jgi:beta-galactosidase GanA
LYDQDIGMLADVGLNTFRFSIEWARVEPVEGMFSLAALRHYRDVLEACSKRGIKSMVSFNRPGGALPPPKGAEMTSSHMEYYPQALEATIRYAAEHVRLPIHVGPYSTTSSGSSVSARASA